MQDGWIPMSARTHTIIYDFHIFPRRGEIREKDDEFELDLPDMYDYFPVEFVWYSGEITVE